MKEWHVPEKRSWDGGTQLVLNYSNIEKHINLPCMECLKIIVNRLQEAKNPVTLHHIQSPYYMKFSQHFNFANSAI